MLFLTIKSTLIIRYSCSNSRQPIQIHVSDFFDLNLFRSFRFSWSIFGIIFVVGERFFFGCFSLFGLLAGRRILFDAHQFVKAVLDHIDIGWPFRFDENFAFRYVRCFHCRLQFRLNRDCEFGTVCVVNSMQGVANL